MYVSGVWKTFARIRGNVLRNLHCTMSASHVVNYDSNRMVYALEWVRQPSLSLSEWRVPKISKENATNPEVTLIKWH